MLVGVPKEIKTDEGRVAIVPAGVEELASRGHEVVIEAGAGRLSGIEDDTFRAAGARIVPTAAEVWGSADMILKVKEPVAPEYARVRQGQVVFTYFHFAASAELTEAMIASGAWCLAYETLARGRSLPLLTPMSEVAGRMAVQEGARYLEHPCGGAGILLGGVPGVPPAEVLIIGGGTVGSNAARMAAGLGARVTILDVDLDQLRYLADVMPPNVTPLYSTSYNIREHLRRSHLVIGAVLRTGERAPLLVPRAALRSMIPGSVIVDVAVDQGGCIETCRPTTHSSPTYVVDGIVHYCVANMPGAVPRTSTFALTNATLPWALRVADKGVREALRASEELRSAANVCLGKVTHTGVAEAFARTGTPVTALI